MCAGLRRLEEDDFLPEDDLLIDWFLGAVHFLFELAHLLIESIEYMIEVLLEHTLQTDSQQSDIIIVNGTIFIALYVLYRLYLATPTLCVRCKQMLCNFFSRWIRRESIYWKTLPLSQKINWTIYHVSGFSGLLFLLTL